MYLVLVVLSCMPSVTRLSFEVVKEGRILHFVSGYRRFAVNARIIQGVAGSIPAPERKRQLEDCLCVEPVPIYRDDGGLRF